MDSELKSLKLTNIFSTRVKNYSCSLLFLIIKISLKTHFNITPNKPFDFLNKVFSNID